MSQLSGSNGAGGFFPQQSMDRGVEGAPGSGRLPFARSMSNPILAEITDVVYDTAGDGVYSFVITDPRGIEHTVTFTRGSGETLTQIIDELVDFANGLASLNGVVVASNVSGTTVRLTFEHPGISYVVDQEAAAAGTVTVTETQAAGGTAQEIARFVDRGAADAGGLPSIADLTGSSDEDTIAGIVLRPIGQFPGIEGNVAQDPDTADVVPAGRIASVAYEGDVWMRNVGGAAAPGGAVHVVRNTAGGQSLGQARGDADGGNTVALPVSNARWIDQTGTNELGRVFVRFS